MILRTIKNILLIFIILNIICFLIELIGFNSITLSFIILLIVLFTIMFLFVKQKYTQNVNVFNFKSEKEIETLSNEESMNQKSTILQIIEISLVILIALIGLSIFLAV